MHQVLQGSLAVRMISSRSWSEIYNHSSYVHQTEGCCNMILWNQLRLALPMVHQCWWLYLGVLHAVFAQRCSLECICIVHIMAPCSGMLQLGFPCVGMHFAYSMPSQFGELRIVASSLQVLQPQQHFACLSMHWQVDCHGHMQLVQKSEESSWVVWHRFDYPGFVHFQHLCGFEHHLFLIVLLSHALVESTCRFWMVDVPHQFACCVETRLLCRDLLNAEQTHK